MPTESVLHVRKIFSLCITSRDKIQCVCVCVSEVNPVEYFPKIDDDKAAAIWQIEYNFVNITSV